MAYIAPRSFKELGASIDEHVEWMVGNRPYLSNVAGRPDQF